jgi:hypothetical protein
VNAITKWALVALTALAASWQSAQAQETARNETVTSRARPELDANGVPLGGFRLFPQLGFTIGHNSNIFADDAIDADDIIYVASPRVELQSNWGRHSLVAGGAAELVRFSDFGNEDHTNSDAWLNGRIDISRASLLRVDAEHAVRHEGRDSANDVRGQERTRFTVDSMTLGYELRPGLSKFSGLIRGEYDRFDFDDVTGPDGPINNDDRDRTRLRGTARLGFDALPNNLLFLQASVEDTQFSDQFDDFGFERSSRGHEVVFGTTLDYSGVTFGELFVGYLSFEFDDARYAAVDGVSFGAEVAWNLTGLTTVTLGGRRTVEPTTLVGASGVLATRYGINVDHELLRNLILGVSWTTLNDDFRGIDRVDEIDTTQFSARYLMNRRVEVTFDFDYTNRKTSPDVLDGFSFSRNIFSLTVEVHL